MAQHPVFPFTDELADAITSFAVHLYQNLKYSREGKNMCFSPLSISTAMGMAQLGARGDTAEQIAQAFKFNKIDKEQLHQAFKWLNDSLYLKNRSKQQVHPVDVLPLCHRYVITANKLYGKSGFPFLQSFIEDTAQFYYSGIEAVDDFSSPDAIKSINDWVSERTEGKINNLLDPGTLGPLTRLLLINAIYFKARWRTTFSKQDTIPTSFQIGGSREKILADFMRKECKYLFASDKDNHCNVISMPYDDIDVTMLIALPDEVDGLSALEDKLSVDIIHGWIENLCERNVYVLIPKFSIKDEFELKESLQAMGISDAFDAKRANFKGVNDDIDLFLSAMIHKTFIDINEEGCEAAAATCISWGLTYASCCDVREEPVTFRADHPFLFIILHRLTKAILFIGRLVDPRL